MNKTIVLDHNVALCKRNADICQHTAALHTSPESAITSTIIPTQQWPATGRCGQNFSVPGTDLRAPLWRSRTGRERFTAALQDGSDKLSPVHHCVAAFFF